MFMIDLYLVKILKIIEKLIKSRDIEVFFDLFLARMV